MKITILTLFPEQFTSFVDTSIIKNAIIKQKVEIECVNIRDYTLNKHHRVDDKPYGGGAGLVMQCQPVIDAIKAHQKKESVVIYLSPAAPLFNQQKAHELAHYSHLILLCGHYEGIDERILKYVDQVISIGDYVLTGGELAAMVVSDAIIRLLDGVITKESILEESFEDDLLEYPHYTTPAVFDDQEVPKVLLSGHHANIKRYRLKEALRKTRQHRPDLLAKRKLSALEEQLLLEIEKTDPS